MFTFVVNAGRSLVLPGGLPICFQPPACLLHVRPILNAELGGLIIDESWRELFPVLQVHRCTKRASPITALLYPICETILSVFGTRHTLFVSLRNSAQPFRQSSELGTPLSSIFGIGIVVIFPKTTPVRRVSAERS